MSRAIRSPSAARNGAPSNLANIGESWARADLFFLEDALKRGMSFEGVAGFLRRTSDEVREKAKDLNR
jgi:hypothetical protein